MQVQQQLTFCSALGQRHAETAAWQVLVCSLLLPWWPQPSGWPRTQSQCWGFGSLLQGRPQHLPQTPAPACPLPPGALHPLCFVHQKRTGCHHPAAGAGTWLSCMQPPPLQIHGSPAGRLLGWTVPAAAAGALLVPHLPPGGRASLQQLGPAHQPQECSICGRFKRVPAVVSETGGGGSLRAAQIP